MLVWMVVTLRYFGMRDGFEIMLFWNGNLWRGGGEGGEVKFGFGKG